jgi:hypothetical protein
VLNKKGLFLHGKRLDEKRLQKLGFVKREMEIPKVGGCYQDVHGRVSGWHASHERLKRL